jgi:hypothetical protein
MSGAIRPVGMVVAMFTAAAVFGVGMLVLPPIEPPAPEPVAPPPPPIPPPPPAPVPAPTLDGPVAEARPAAPDAQPTPSTAETKPEPAQEAGQEPKQEPSRQAKAEAQPEPKPKADKTPSAPAVAPAKVEAPTPREKQVDKEVARDAWRKNLPDIAAEPGKASMLIPIKGSIEGSTYHVTAKPRSVLITLPKGESMITMPFYNVRHDGFRQLWIKKDDETGTVIRVVLGDGIDPQVEIKDEFVRVTVRRLADAGAAAPAPTPAAAAPGSPAPTPAEAAPRPAGAD